MNTPIGDPYAIMAEIVLSYLQKRSMSIPICQNYIPEGAENERLADETLADIVRDPGLMPADPDWVGDLRGA